MGRGWCRIRRRRRWRRGGGVGAGVSTLHRIGSRNKSTRNEFTVHDRRITHIIPLGDVYVQT